MFWESEQVKEWRVLAEDLWAEIVRQFFNFAEWLQNLSTAEQTIGICIFIVFLVYLIVRRSSRDKDPGGNQRQFTGAFMVVLLIAFGVGWSFDLEAGSLSYIFDR